MVACIVMMSEARQQCVKPVKPWLGDESPIKSVLCCVPPRSVLCLLARASPLFCINWWLSLAVLTAAIGWRHCEDVAS